MAMYPLALGNGLGRVGVLKVETEVDDGQQISCGLGLDRLDHVVSVWVCVGDG